MRFRDADWFMPSLREWAEAMVGLQAMKGSPGRASRETEDFRFRASNGAPKEIRTFDPLGSQRLVK